MNLISRQKAQDAGLKRYYTGKPCRNGHDSERYTGSATCIACVYQANGQAPKASPGEPVAAPLVNRRTLINAIPEHRHRVFHGDVEALRAIAASLCIAEIGRPDIDPIETYSGRASTKYNGDNALYSFRYPDSAIETMQALANAYFAARCVRSDAELAKLRGSIVRQATEIALEDRPAPEEWKFI